MRRRSDTPITARLLARHHGIGWPSSFARPGDADIGLVFLTEEMTDREPAVINPDGARLGTLPVDLVGFGETENGGFGRLMYALAKPQTTCGPFGVDGSAFICLDRFRYPHAGRPRR